MDIQIKPVCDCGYVFQDGIEIHNEIVFVDGIYHDSHMVYPYKCPQCGEMIDRIICNGWCKTFREKISFK